MIGRFICAATRARMVSARSAQVFGPLSEWRDYELDDVEAIEEILSEPPLLHVLREVPVRRGDDTRVELPLAILADAPDLVFLQSAEELHLQGQRHLSDLVEEQRALVGGLEQAWTVLDGAGERTARVTEQLALKERVRASAPQLTGTNGPLARGEASWMKSRESFLADAALADDQDGRIDSSDARGEADQAPA